MSKLDELKDLLFSDEQRVLEDISDRLETPDRRVADLAEVLPESIEESHKRGRLASAMRKPLAEVMTVAIREDPQDYADALFPVIGPAIRKAVAEAFKSLTQQFNQAIEHSVTPQGLRWRFEAWRSGVPFSQYLMQRTLLYQVEQAYLIDAESGLLISHVADESIQYKDEDAVSAMFTALQEFIKDAFLGNQKKGLESAEMGDLTIWAMHGPESILACVIRGLPPRSLRTDMREILETIEGRYRETLIGFSGEREESAEIEQQLRKCLRSSTRPEMAGKKSGKISPATVLGIIVVLLALVWIGRTIITTMQTRRLAGAFESTPGIVLTDIGRSDGKLVVTGFRDPLAEPPASIVSRAELRAEHVIMHLTAFVSLDPDIVTARAIRMLEPPDTISIASTESGPAISGRATSSWLLQARDRVRFIPGLEDTIFNVEAIDPINVEKTEFDTLARKLNGATLRFETNDRLEPGQDELIENLSADLVKLTRYAEMLGIKPVIVITGFSDASGSSDVNSRVQLMRSRQFATALEEAAGRSFNIELMAAGSDSSAKERKAVLGVGPNAGRRGR